MKPNRIDTFENTALRYSVRIAGSVTSLSLRRNLVALWLTLNTDEIVDFNSGVKGSLNGLVLNFIYKCIAKWKKNNGRGLSDFVSDMMIQDIVDSDDYAKYKSILITI
jgi:hypothetical protein